MKNLTKLLGIFALVAVIEFSLTGCDTGIDEITKSSLTGNVSLNNNSPKVGESITATYAPGNGSGPQTWQWFRVDTGAEDLIQNATTNVYTATANDVGKKIKAQLSYADRSGSLSATTTNAVTATPTAVTYTIARADGVDGTADTTAITFTFSASVTGLTENDIIITNGTGSLTKGTLSGSGTSWTLGVTVTTAGNVTIAIAKTGIEAGTKDVTVYKTGQTAPTLNSISAVYTQGSSIIYPTTPLDSLKAGLTVTAAYNNGATLPVTAYALSVSGSGTLTVGTSAVTVTFEGKTTTFNVTVTATPANKTLTGITLNTTSVKRDYNQNETLDLTSLVVTANYSDGSSAAVSYTSSSPANGETLSTTGTITITVNYTEGAVTKTANFSITVTPATPTLTGITAVYTQGSTIIYPTTSLDSLKAGLSVTAAYSNGTNQPVTSYALSGKLTVGASAVTVTYEGKTTIFTVTVTEIPPTEGLEYELIDSGTAYRVSRGWATGAIHIPAFYRSDASSEYLPVTEIGNGYNERNRNAFGGTWTTQNTTVTSITFAEGSQLTTVGGGAFQGCSRLTSITIPDSVMSIGNSAFSGCTNLTSVTFAEGSQLTIVGGSAFQGCSRLTSITIPDSVMSIGNSAFSGCTGLTSVTIPPSVTSIGNSAFDDCANLRNIIIDNDKAITYNDNSFSTSNNWLTIFPATNLSVIFKKYVGNYAFSSSSANTRLTSVTIAEGVTFIGTRAFYYCTGLTSITIPSSVTAIGTEAFYYCTGLTSITIPASVTAIGNYAFSGCADLTSVTFEGTIANSSFATNAFLGNLRGIFYQSNSAGTPGTYIVTSGTGIFQEWTRQW